MFNQQDGVDVKSNGSLKGALETLHNVVNEDTELQELVSPAPQIALTYTSYDVFQELIHLEKLNLEQ